LTGLPRTLGRLGWIVLVGWPRPGLTQTLLTGRVTGAGRALSSAEIRIEASELRAVTGENGSYRLVIQGPGIVRVSVRAVGFYPATRRFMLVGDDTTVADFDLAPAPQPLDSITVEAPRPPVPAKMRGFEDRRHRGFGRFYARDFLAQKEASTLANVLRLTSNLQLVRRPPECGGGFSVATGRSGGIAWAPWMSCGGRGRLLPACYSTIYLDGISYWAPGMPGVPPPDIDQLRIVDLEGIEVYRSSSEAPLQYLSTGTVCGVILLWTRVGR
jgi:hypothetical protein